MIATDWIRIFCYTVTTLTMLDCARYLTPKKGSSDIQRAFFAMLCVVALLSLNLLLTLLASRGLLPLDFEFTRAFLTVPVVMVALTCLRIFYLFRIKK